MLDVNVFFFTSRSLDQKPTSSYTLRFTCERRSPTDARNVLRHSQTHHTLRSTLGSTWGSSLTAARSARGSLHSCPTCSSISAHIPVTNPTAAPKLAALKPSPSSLTYKATAVATKPINHSNAIPATNASRTKRTFWSTFLNTKSRSI